MKFHEFKILENKVPHGSYIDKVARLLVIKATEACKRPLSQRKRYVRRVNSLLTDIRRTSQQYDSKKTLAAVAAHLKNKSPTLSSLVSKTKFQANNELIINVNGESEPPFTVDMCGPPVGGNDIGGGTGTGTGTKQGDGDTTGRVDGTVPFGSSLGGKGGTVPGYKPGEKGDGTSDTGKSTKPGNADTGTDGVADSYASEIGVLSGLIEKGDKEGAINYLDANPEFEKAIGDSFRTDIQKSIDADNAAEANRIKKEKAEEEAKAAADLKAKQEAEAEVAARKEAEEKAEAEAAAREKVLQAEKDAKAAEEKAAEEKAAKEAEIKRKEADRLEQERLKAEAEADRIRKEAEKEKITVKPDPEEKKIEPGDVEDYNWEDLQP